MRPRSYHGSTMVVFVRIALTNAQCVRLRSLGMDGNIRCVGSLEPRKNLLRLLKAYSMLDTETRDRHHLVIAGFRGWRSEEVEREAAQLAPAVAYVGYVGRQELSALYRHASLFVYPSLYEGFGLPPLEAMACGAPTPSRHPRCPRGVGAGGCACDTARAESIAESLNCALADPPGAGVGARRWHRPRAGMSLGRRAQRHTSLYARSSRVSARTCTSVRKAMAVRAR